VSTLPADRICLTVNAARALGEDMLRRIGYDTDEAWVICDHVLDAALCGYEYSGLPKLLNIAEHWRAKLPRTPMTVAYETPLSTLYDGGNNVGMLTMYHATKAAIAKAQGQGIGLVGVCNSWMSGRSAYFVEMIARADLVGIHTVGAQAHVAPPGGRAKAIGTNPIAIGVPTRGDPLVVDLGTSAFMGTDLQFRERRGELLPAGVAIDPDGNPTRDPRLARLGALLPMAGHKGYALALAFHALGALAGSGRDLQKQYGYLIVAIRPDLLVPLDELKGEVTALVERVRATPRQAGVDAIRIPSERSYRERARHLREGIVIDRSIRDAILATGTAAGNGN
jgi:LDH2 family malate/lactate/ureidoglycolate dehydrogenase